MKIGIIGSGDVAQALGTGFVKSGHQVKMGSRDPTQKKIVDWVTGVGSNSSAGTSAEAATFGDIVVLATVWTGAENAIKLANPSNMKGKIVIDVTNPLDFSKGMPPGLLVGHMDSAGETVQRWLPDSKVVKAFNTVGHVHMFKPDFPNGPPDMFICGNDEGAKKAVTGILNTFGWSSVIDIGDIEGSRLLEPMCVLWVTYGVRSNSWNHAFKMLKK